MSEKLQPVQKGYIMIVDEAGKVVSMPMMSEVCTVCEAFNKQYGAKAEEELEFIEDFWSRAYPDCTVIIR